MQYIQNPHKN